MRCDIAILGGGLAGGLIALALQARRPDINVRLVEAGKTLGGNHIWSFFDSDVANKDRWLVKPLICHHWNAYDVAFPAYARTLPQAYNSIESCRLDTVIRSKLEPHAIVHNSVLDYADGKIALKGGEAVITGAIIDARGPGDVATLTCGWQKFVGQMLHLDAPHGIERPVVMDATADQIDGYRFVYLLPFSTTSVFIEDTYYSNTPELDVDASKARIVGYAKARGWKTSGVDRMETGALPVIMAGDFEAYWRSTGTGSAKAGMRAGLCHPTTGYSLPDAVRLASLIAEASDLSGAALEKLTHDYARDLWRQRGFYRMLDTMLFRAAEPRDRYRILERFYRLSPELIGRFYAGQTTLRDKARILLGRPPVPVGRAISALFGGLT